jgi:hypothetical protein
MEDNETNENTTDGDGTESIAADLAEMLTQLEALMEKAESAGPEATNAVMLAGSRSLATKTLNRAFDAAMAGEWVKAARSAKTVIEMLDSFGQFAVAEGKKSGEIPTVRSDDGETEMLVMDGEGNIVDADDLASLPGPVRDLLEQLRRGDLNGVPDQMIGLRVDPESGEVVMVDEDGTEHPWRPAGPTGEARRAKRGNPMPGGYL